MSLCLKNVVNNDEIVLWLEYKPKFNIGIEIFQLLDIQKLANYHDHIQRE